MKFRDPQTDEEWQDAINGAAFWLLVDDARLYGLCVGGPDVDRDRCVELLARGRERGVWPKTPAIWQEGSSR